MPTISQLMRHVWKSVWLFPTILLLLLVGLTLLRLSGTSIGIYSSLFNGNAKDPDLILNKPLPVRSDEWLVTTQLTIAQSVAGFPRVNPNIDSGRDMSIVGDAPYKDWSIIFRPQNLAFLALPLEYAFAFKWWLLIFLTMVSSYFLVLRFFADKRLVAALIGTSVGLSPFLIWWYGTGTLATIFYGIFIILVGMRIINGDRLTLLSNRRYAYSLVCYIGALAYLLTAFVLILYPPFQIPVVLVVTAFLIGYFLNQHAKSWCTLVSGPARQQLGAFLLGGVIAGLLVFTFVQTRQGPISAIGNTVYPGSRVVKGGGGSAVNLMSSYLQPQLQRKKNDTNYYTNQSEASNFILLLPFLLIPGFVLLFYEYARRRHIDWPLLTVQLSVTLLLLYLFVPGLQLLYHTLFLDKVPHGRLIMGLGFAGILQMLLIMRAVKRLEVSPKVLNLVAGGYALVCLGVLVGIGQYTRTTYPDFVSNPIYIFVLAVLFCIIIFCFLSKRLLIGACFLLLISAGSVFQIHPLYRGLGPIHDSELSRVMNDLSSPGDTWVTTDNLSMENLALIGNQDSLTGIKPYPDVVFWRKAESPKGDLIYNRYAHSVAVSAPEFKDPLRLIQPDFFVIGLSCSKFITTQVDFVLNTAPVDRPCLQLEKKLVYPGVTFFIYRVHQ